MVSILLALPMSYAVYRSAAILFGGARVAATAAILLNVTLMAAVGTLIVTPDAPLLVARASCCSSSPRCWRPGEACGGSPSALAVGAALLSKYTALFFGAAILIWLAAVPKLRRWLLSPWPYLGGLVAFALFSPVILWNADHQWVSSSSRSAARKIEDFRPAFIAELMPTQIAFATPLVFILGAMGLHALTWRRTGALASRVLVNAMFWTIVAYFVWHSLHARVEANWFAPVYPAFAFAAAAPPISCRGRAARRRLADFCLRWAAPAGIVMFALLIVQANTGWLSGYRRDATVRSVGVGWRELAAEIEAVRVRSRRDLRARAGLRHHGLARLLLAAGTCVRSRTSASAGSTCPSPIRAARRQAALCRRGRAARAHLLQRLVRASPKSRSSRASAARL